MRWVVPWPPGGSTDAIARLIASQVGPLLGQPVVIDNRSGVGGVLGSEHVAKAAPDGLTALVSDGALATAPSLRRSLNFDPAKDLDAVCLCVALPHVIAVRPDFPAQTLAEFIAEAKKRNLDFGSGGIGSPLHLAGELFRLAADVSWTHVPYRGAAPAVTALLAGEVQVAVPSLPAVVGHIRGGRLRGLAVTGAQRAPLLPDVPTVAESDLPTAQMAGWVGLHFPGGTPPAQIERLQAAAQQALKEPQLQARLAEQGAQIVASGAEAYRGFIRAETDRWSRVIRAAGIEPE
jgi:tripartite-type tricarboxylate transporter receptor subunit TctC